MDAAAREMMRACAYGQAVWSCPPDAGVKFAGWRCRPLVRHAAQAMVAKEPGHQGERGAAVKPLRRECRDVSVVPVVLAHVLRRMGCPCASARGIYGCIRHSAFPAPSDYSEGHDCSQSSGDMSRENAGPCSPLSSSAKADDPVVTSLRCEDWIPRLRGG